MERVVAVLMLLLGIGAVVIAGLLWIGYGMSESDNLALLLAWAIPLTLLGALLVAGSVYVLRIPRVDE